MNSETLLRCAAMVLVFASLLASCATTTAGASQTAASATAASTATAEYPTELHGHWMPVDLACTTPINYDSDVLVVIDKNQLGHYEDASKPVEVRKLSSAPHAWSIKSLLNVAGDGYDVPVSEVFVLGGRQLAIGGEHGIRSYQRCD
jgi:hypothetical protein